MQVPVLALCSLYALTGAQLQMEAYPVVQYVVH